MRLLGWLATVAFIVGSRAGAAEYDTDWSDAASYDDVGQCNDVPEQCWVDGVDTE